MGEQLSVGGDASRPWQELSGGFEQARAREDSLDTLVEWPAEKEFLGDVAGMSILDAGCGNGAKLAELVAAGATGVGVDLAGNFPAASMPGLELIQADLSDLSAVPGLAGRRFDRILFLQSFGYAADPVRALEVARHMLTDGGYILLTRTQPMRYALESAAQNGTTVGEEYFARGAFSYRHSNWDDAVTLTKRRYTMSDLLNTFSRAGLWIEETREPHMTAEHAARFPEKYRRVNERMIGILMFKLRPVGHEGR